jgi:putative endonuclease
MYTKIDHYNFVEYCLYILYSSSIEKYYIGQTEDLKERVEQHNIGKSRSTKHEKPWKLVYHEKYLTRSEAVLRERFLKSPSGWKELKEIKKKITSGT